MRVFSAPQNFIVNFSHISGIGINEQVTGAVPLGASTPALGLSNKAVFTGMRWFIYMFLSLCPFLLLSSSLSVSDSSVDEGNGAESSSVKNSFSSEVPVFSPIELTGICQVKNIIIIIPIGPPTEEHLLQNTLWPEAQKL